MTAGNQTPPVGPTSVPDGPVNGYRTALPQVLAPMPVPPTEDPPGPTPAPWFTPHVPVEAATPDVAEPTTAALPTTTVAPTGTAASTTGETPETPSTPPPDDAARAVVPTTVWTGAFVEVAPGTDSAAADPISTQPPSGAPLNGAHPAVADPTGGHRPVVPTGLPPATTTLPPAAVTTTAPTGGAPVVAPTTAIHPANPVPARPAAPGHAPPQATGPVPPSVTGATPVAPAAAPPPGPGRLRRAPVVVLLVVVLLAGLAYAGYRQVTGDAPDGWRWVATPGYRLAVPQAWADVAPGTPPVTVFGVPFAPTAQAAGYSCGNVGVARGTAASALIAVPNGVGLDQAATAFARGAGEALYPGAAPQVAVGPPAERKLGLTTASRVEATVRTDGANGCRATDASVHVLVVPQTTAPDGTIGAAVLVVAGDLRGGPPKPAPENRDELLAIMDSAALP